MSSTNMVILLVVVIVVLIFQDYESEQIERQHYCEMVDLWNSADHMPLDKRHGWPPYEGECDGQD